MPPLLADLFRLGLHICWVYLPYIIGGTLSLLAIIVGSLHIYRRWKEKDANE